MNILDQLPKQPIKTEPDVWVRRLVLYAKLTPTPEVIRDIGLHRGMNIVWAEEPESETDKSDIAGHSAGKTTFCRLVRYVLGEKTYANKSSTQAIRKSFPNGYVAAEIFVRGAQWAVLRPLGENRNSWVLKGGTVEQVVTDKGEPAYQETYPDKIGLAGLLEGLASATVVRTQEAIKWGHVLAWCARDQEARFQNIYDWRSSRSESEWPTFRFPKSDPLFVMRVVLGLYLPDELSTEELLSANLRALEKAEADLERLKREPEFWHQHYDGKVRERLKRVLTGDAAEIDKAPLVSPEVLLDLKRFVEKAKYLIAESLDILAKENAALQTQLNALNESLAQGRNELRQIEALFQLGEKAAGEIDAGLKKNDEFRKKAAEYKDRMCPLGGVLFGQCNYVQDRQARLQPGELREAHTLEQMEAQRAEERRKITAQHVELRKKIQLDEQQRSAALEQQGRVGAKMTELAMSQTTLDQDLANLGGWQARLEAPEKSEKMKAAIQEIASLKEEIDTKRARLNGLLADHDSNRDLLNKIFSESARLVLPSSNYDGRVSFQDRELNFQITHGGAMSGEAMETLAVLLADMSCVIFNSLSNSSHLPGFLLHDSPREADLGLRLYHAFIRFVAAVEANFAARGGCPFQYILTTTTPPPRAVADKAHIALRLDASKESELLFRRNLARPPDEVQLQLPES